VGKPKPASRKQPARTAPIRPSRPAAGRPLWLSLAAVAVLGAVAVAWLTARPSSQGANGQPGGGVRAVGQLAPPVRLPATTGQTIDLAGFRGKRNVLLYFYEHAG
jgi:cytochrome oxidase Cu insertion factor (SCO1/SenC/PrrC family)